MASGDTVYLCPGTYREAVTVAMTSAVATTTVSGDPGNVQGFKDANAVLVPGGEVQWTGFTVNDYTPNANSTVNLAGRDFLSFSNIVFVCGNGFGIDGNTTKTSTDITLTDCCFIAATGSSGLMPVIFAAAANVALNLTVTRCMFLGGPGSGSGGAISLNIDTPATADFNINVAISNCNFSVGGTAHISIAQGLTANVFKYGGVTINNCNFVGGTVACFRAFDTNHSTSVTSAIYNSVCFGTIRAFTSGQILEDYNSFYTNAPRTNVAVGTHSVAGIAPLMEVGQASFIGGTVRPYGMPSQRSPLLGFGANAGGPAVDLLNRSRSSGVSLFDTGTASAGAAKTLTDATKAWGVNAFRGFTVQITGGTGSGQTKQIATNTATALTVDGNWKTNPNNTSVYQIYWGDSSSTGTATAGTTTTMTDGNAAWGVNQWTGYILSFDSGTGSPQTATVTSNTATVITFPLATAPDATTTYSLYKATGITTQDYAVGAFERQDSAQKETTTTDAGSVGIAITGQGSHEFNIPVDATATTISVRCSWDTAHGNGSKPQATLLANGEISVTTETVTAAGTSPTWETLTFATQTPTAKGIVTVRLISRSAVSNGRAFFDTFGVA